MSRVLVDFHSGGMAGSLGGVYQPVDTLAETAVEVVARVTPPLDETGHADKPDQRCVFLGRQVGVGDVLGFDQPQRVREVSTHCPLAATSARWRISGNTVSMLGVATLVSVPNS